MDDWRIAQAPRGVRALTSVVIAAHNEEVTIDRCLRELLRGPGPTEFEVIVVANGCSDGTAARARAHAGVQVVELAEASKSAALNAGDSVASGFPRIYLDADMAVPSHAVRSVAQALVTSGALAAFPDRTLDLAGRPLAVRAYFAINSRLPAFRDGLFGRGLIGVSERGRKRFVSFPNMIADDLFLDSVFDPSERIKVSEVSTLVATPLRTRDLVRRLVRVRRGNAEMREAARSGEVAGFVRPVDRWAWLRDVVVRNPRLLPAASVYVLLTLWAAALSRRDVDDDAIWGRDDSTRQVAERPTQKGVVP